MMKILIEYRLLVLLFVLCLLTYPPSTYAKKRCKPFLEKLHHIQALQRKGYSLKRGQNLRGKEDKARDKWWQCENSSLAKFKKMHTNTKKSQKSKSNKKKSKKYMTTLSAKKKNNVSTKNKVMTTFNQGSAIVIKSKYQGEQQTAWLKYYQKPKKCKQPKTLNIFAYCNDNKLQQQNEFDKKVNQ